MGAGGTQGGLCQPRIRLEAPEARHCEAFLAAVAASRALHHPWVSPPSTNAGFRAYLDRLRSPRELGFLVVTADGALAGVVNISEIVAGPFRSGYLGYYGFVPHAGRGRMEAGLDAVIRRAFRRHGLHRLEANIQPGNLASIRLVRRLGFRREGFSPRYLKIRGRWRDHERWTVLADDRRPRTAKGSRGEAEPVKVELAPLTRDNWRQCARLELAEGQERLVAPNVASIAESRFEPHYEPRAIYADGEMAGFLMYCPETEPDEPDLYWIFRLMTDRRRQGQGIGARALRAALAEIAARGGRRVKICHVPENAVAARLYRRLGFEPTGEIEEGEIVLALSIKGPGGL